MFTLFACILSFLIVLFKLKATTRSEKGLKALSLGCFALGILIELGAFK